jgi:hypothetical protein
MSGLAKWMQGVSQFCKTWKINPDHPPVESKSKHLPINKFVDLQKSTSGRRGSYLSIPTSNHSVALFAAILFIFFQ